MVPVSVQPLAPLGPGLRDTTQTDISLACLSSRLN